MATQTPFRYPGAKNRLLPKLMVHIDPMLVGQESFADAFVGGGSVLLEVATQYPNIKLFANDKDYGVYAFWKIVSDEDRTQLDQLLDLMTETPTIQLFNALREDCGVVLSEVSAAYRCIFFNRTTFSGIARSGPIGGQEQKSKWTVDCRYNFPKLKAKMEKCHQLLVGRTTVENKDILEYGYLVDGAEPVYLDPPYYLKGDMLYSEKMSGMEHGQLSSVLHSRPNWVLSYDNAVEIRDLYKNHKIIDIDARYCIDGKKDQWKNHCQELIILP